MLLILGSIPWSSASLPGLTLFMARARGSFGSLFADALWIVSVVLFHYVMLGRVFATHAAAHGVTPLRSFGSRGFALNSWRLWIFAFHYARPAVRPFSHGDAGLALSLVPIKPSGVLVCRLADSCRSRGH